MSMYGFGACLDSCWSCPAWPKAHVGLARHGPRRVVTYVSPFPMLLKDFLTTRQPS